MKCVELTEVELVILRECIFNYLKTLREIARDEDDYVTKVIGSSIKTAEILKEKLR